MIRLLLSTCILCVFGVSVRAQVESQEKLNPLILVDTAFTYNESLIVHPSRFLSISILNPKKAIELYGTLGRFGAILIETRHDIAFVRIASILDKFRVEEKYRALRVCINKIPIAEPDKILADINEIRNVEILSYVTPGKAVDANASYFINIVTLAGL